MVNQDQLANMKDSSLHMNGVLLGKITSVEVKKPKPLTGYFKTEAEKKQAMIWFESLSNGQKSLLMKNLGLSSPKVKEIHKYWQKNHKNK